MEEKKKRVFVVDGYGQIYRSYFAFMTNPLKDKEGNNVSAVYGFFNTLISLLRQYQPEYIVVAMDSKGKTFRHQMYEQYKANRDKTPEDLHAQIPVINSYLDAMHIPHFNREGMEADDIIATIAKKASSESIETVMVTGDKDLLQLVRDDVFALRPPRKGEKEYRLCAAAEVKEIFGVRPDQIVDYLTILGDTSDNVPGIDGIGEKGAVKLLVEYDSLSNAYDNIGSLAKGIASKLEAAKDHIALSHDLVMLKDDVLEHSLINFAEFETSKIDWNEGVRLFQAMGSNTLTAAAKKMVPAQQFTLESAQEEQVKDLFEVATSNYKSMTEDGLASYLEAIKDNALVAVSVQYSCEDDMIALPLSLCFSPDAKTCNKITVPLNADNLKMILNKNLCRYRLVGQNLKSMFKVLKRWGVSGCKAYADTMLAQWLLNTNLTKFDAEDSAQSYANFIRLEQELKDKGLYELFMTMEMPLSDVLCSMELQGIKLDAKRLESFGRDLEKELISVQNDIYTLCGKTFNLNSTKQLQEVLFVDRNLPTGKKNKVWLFYRF